MLFCNLFSWPGKRDCHIPVASPLLDLLFAPTGPEVWCHTLLWENLKVWRLNELPDSLQSVSSAVGTWPPSKGRGRQRSPWGRWGQPRVKTLRQKEIGRRLGNGGQYATDDESLGTTKSENSGKEGEWMRRRGYETGTDDGAADEENFKWGLGDEKDKEESGTPEDNLD